EFRVLDSSKTKGEYKESVELVVAIRKKINKEYAFGMKALLKLDLNGTRSFFDAFFDLNPEYWHGFLSSRLSLMELAMLSLSLFGHSSNSSRID
ncbi:hypothetical protein Tco_1451781, partial [Tanacetum coccineum]